MTPRKFSLNQNFSHQIHMQQYVQETPAEREIKNMVSANLTLSFPRYARSWIWGRAGGPLHIPPESARTKALRVKTSIVAKTSFSLSEHIVLHALRLHMQRGASHILLRVGGLQGPS